MTKFMIIEKIKRRLGYPMVKVELDTRQIEDAIDEARQKWIKWAAGEATQEVFFTILLSGGQHIYDMPIGVIDVINYSANEGLGKINTLFTLDNYLYMHGYYDGLFASTYDGFNMINYHVARDFLETVKRYQVDAYNFKYHKYGNKLEIQPIPECGNVLTIPERVDCNGIVYPGVTVDSPGFILIDSFMIAGSTLPGYDETDNKDDLYVEDWILDYATALSMRTLGFIRRKFENSAGMMGNAGVQLDGSSLVTDANEWLDKLKETLKSEEPSIGYGISIGW